MTIPTKPFEPAKFFQTDESQIELIRDAISTGHAGYIEAAIRAVLRARGL